MHHRAAQTPARRHSSFGCFSVGDGWEVEFPNLQRLFQPELVSVVARGLARAWCTAWSASDYTAKCPRAASRCIGVWRASVRSLLLPLPLLGVGEEGGLGRLMGWGQPSAGLVRSDMLLLLLATEIQPTKIRSRRSSSKRWAETPTRCLVRDFRDPVLRTGRTPRLKPRRSRAACCEHRQRSNDLRRRAGRPSSASLHHRQNRDHCLGRWSDRGVTGPPLPTRTTGSTQEERTAAGSPQRGEGAPIWCRARGARDGVLDGKSEPRPTLPQVRVRAHH
jgi:hypothetical protein